MDAGIVLLQLALANLDAFGDPNVKYF